MREIGGYIELDKYSHPMLHDGAIALNCGRNALAYLLKARAIKRLWIPKLICRSVTDVCDREGVSVSYYSVNMDFRPDMDISLGNDEWLYFVNYYSQFDNEEIAEFVHRYQRVIVDNAQSYFQAPIPHVDTIYTCRKYFGVADGAFLYTDASVNEILPLDESFDRMRFLLGRFERTANEFYNEYIKNNKQFAKEPIKQMSKLTQNLLHGVEYERAKRIREENFAFLQEEFCDDNLLKLRKKIGTFMYPLMLDYYPEIRQRLQKERIYIPILWPEILERCREDEPEYQLANNILPLPIDQRYKVEDMKYLAKSVRQAMEK